MSIKDLSLSELLDLANKGIDGKLGTSDKNLLDRSSVGRYVKDRGLMEGTDLVPTFIVYHDYCKNWAPRGKKTTKIEFFRKFNKYFNQKRKTKQRYYLMDSSQFDMDVEELQKAKDYVKRREAQTLRKVKKKKRKIPSS